MAQREAATKTETDSKSPEVCLNMPDLTEEISRTPQKGNWQIHFLT